VDDDAAVRESIAMQMEIAGYEVASYPGADVFLDNYTAGTSGCLILDIHMPGMDGPTLQAELSRRDWNLPIIFLSAQGTIPLAVRTMKAGAMDFLTKPVDGEILRNRVQKALERCTCMQNEFRKSRDIAARLAKLSEREREVMMLSIEGLTCKEIAIRLNISYRTVETHRARLILKTATSNMMELARIVVYQNSYSY
jgi:FixJ family two-component response regulator